jgi:hypothetical protein
MLATPLFPLIYRCSLAASFFALAVTVLSASPCLPPGCGRHNSPGIDPDLRSNGRALCPALSNDPGTFTGGVVRCLPRGLSEEPDG